MSGELRVDVDGLRSAAGSSGALAEGLAAGADAGPDSPSTSHPSVAGVAAVNAALKAMTTRHATRIGGQSGLMHVASGVFERTDTAGGEGITTVSV